MAAVFRCVRLTLVRIEGLEPPSTGFVDLSLIQLDYLRMVALEGFEPSLPGLEGQYPIHWNTETYIKFGEPPESLTQPQWVAIIVVRRDNGS